MQTIKPIRSNDDLTADLARIGNLWVTDPNTPEVDELNALCDLIKHDENHTYPIEQMGSVELLNRHMEITGQLQLNASE